MVDSLLTPKDVGDRLNVPTGTLSQWRHRGIGPDWIKLGGHIRYRAEDVEAWVAAQTRTGGLVP
jgi:excisionase family DNA binding protein